MTMQEPPQPNQQDLGMSDDDIQEFLATIQEEPPSIPGVGADDDQGGETPPVSPPVVEDEGTPPAAADGIWEWEIPTEDGGSEKLSLTKEQARTLAQFDTWLAANPDMAATIAGVVQGELQVVPRGAGGEPIESRPVAPAPPASPPAAQQAPDDLDLDDPTIKRLWDENQTTKQQLAAASEVLTRHEAAIQAQTQDTTQALVNRAVSDYATKHAMDEAQVTRLRQQAARLNIIGSLVDPFDPVTGLPRQVDPVAAVHEALDVAYWSTPEFRQQAMDTAMRSHVEGLRKKQKLTSLGGSSGSVPRTPQPPANETERHNAMIAEVEAAMNGSAQE